MLKSLNLFDQFIFKCECPVIVTTIFKETIKKLPFQSTFIPIEEGFILVIFLPSVGVSWLGEVLQKYVEKVEFM